MKSHISFYVFWVFSKLQRLFFSFCWRVFMLAYFTIGLGALAVLFLIEAQFFIQLTQHTLLGYGITAIFDIAKVGTSIIKQAMTIANKVTRMKVSPLLHGITVIFQIALIVVSLICSMVVITAYLNDSTLLQHEGSWSISNRSGKPFVSATLRMLQEGLSIQVKPATFVSVFAVLVSALFQATSYIVFGHVIATQSKEIEHLFEVKLHRMDAKKNFMSSI